MLTVMIEDYDESNLTALEKAVDLVMINKLAIETALQSHPVTKFVRDLPFEDLSRYPAISNTYTSIIDKKQKREFGPTYRKVHSGVSNMIWSLPAKDKDRSCGVAGSFARGKDSEIGRLLNADISIRTCTVEKKHSAIAICNRCWSLRCQYCMNSQAMKMGVKSENKILAPADIYRRKTGKELEFFHYVISPPQEWVKSIIQNSSDYADLLDDIVAICEDNGLISGVIVFHPWHQVIDHWEAEPHFHIVACGNFTNTNVFRKKMQDIDSEKHIWNDDGKKESWVVKKIHPNKKLKSARQTVAYTLTHVGMNYFDFSVDWDLAAEDLLIPAVMDGTAVRVKEESQFVHDNVSEDDRIWKEDYSFMDWKKIGVDKNGEDVFYSGWEQWVKEKMTGHFQNVRYFGSANKTRILAVHEETKTRMCPICNSPMAVFEGVHDCTPILSQFRKKSVIRVMKDDYDTVAGYWDDNPDIADEGVSVLDFAINIPQCSTPETQGVQEYDPNENPEKRAEARRKRIVYVWAKDGIGMYPIVVDVDEIALLKRNGNLVDVEDRELFQRNEGRRVYQKLY